MILVDGVTLRGENLAADDGTALAAVEEGLEILFGRNVRGLVEPGMDLATDVNLA